MLFDSATKTLYTNEGALLKTLKCDRVISERDLVVQAGNPHRTCRYCEKIVYDTMAFSDLQVSALVARDPTACFQVRINQWNIKTVSIDISLSHG